jgi:DNA repair exonuclease SbcCD ATPase subunit
MRKPAVILLVLGVVLAALGVAGLVMAIPMPGAIGLAAGGIFAAAGALCLYLRGRKKGAQTQFLAQYGLSPTCTEKALAGYLEGCETVSRRHALAEDALADATRLLSERERVLGLLCEECVATLARMGVAADAEDTESLYARLDAALTDFSALAVEHERLRREYERLYVNLREIRLELSGQNEAELRAHLTVEQAQKSAGEDIGKLRSERDYLRRSLADADARRSEMEKQLVSLEATAEDPGALSLQLEELEKTLADCRLRHEALVLAGEALAVASTKVRRGVTPRLRSGAGMWMNKLTGGRYGDLGISASMAITVESEGETRPIEAMSGGTVDAAYLSLRLSLLEVLYGVDRPPLLLDESLCQLDDRRAEHFLSMLTGWCAAGSQCLLFTCQSREAKICRDVGYFEHVKLN